MRSCLVHQLVTLPISRSRKSMGREANRLLARAVASTPLSAASALQCRAANRPMLNWLNTIVSPGDRPSAGSGRGPRSPRDRAPRTCTQPLGSLGLIGVDQLNCRRVSRTATSWAAARVRREAIVVGAIAKDHAEVVAPLGRATIDIDELIAGQLVVGMFDHGRHRFLIGRRYTGPSASCSLAREYRKYRERGPAV